MSEEKIIDRIYYDVFKTKKIYSSQNDFYNGFFDSNEYYPDTRSKVIRGSRNFYKKEKEYYLMEKNRNSILKHLDKLVQKAQGKNEEITSEIIRIIEETNFKSPDQQNKLVKLLTYLAEWRSDQYCYFYYELFRYLVTGYVEDIGKYDAIEKAYREFYEEIVKQYGVSGTTASMMILQKVQGQNTTNPIILYEAAEIEFTKGKAAKKEDDRHLHFQNAYNYYSKAYENGLPLAGWNLGHLAQKDDTAQYVEQYRSLKKKDRLEIAKKYFVKAEKEGCLRAINSLGNLHMSKLSNKEKENPNPENANYKEARKYYKNAAQKNEVHGMYNYGRILEKEIKQDIEKNNSGHISENLKQQEKKINEMIEYFEKAANEGYPPACYRYALYTCGLNLGVEDMIIPKNTTFPISEEEIWTTESVRAKTHFKLAKRNATEDDLRKKATACLKQMRTNNLEHFFGK